MTYFSIGLALPFLHVFELTIAQTCLRVVLFGVDFQLQFCHSYYEAPYVLLQFWNRWKWHANRRRSFWYSAVRGVTPTIWTLSSRKENSCS